MRHILIFILFLISNCAFSTKKIEITYSPELPMSTIIAQEICNNMYSSLSELAIANLDISVSKPYSCQLDPNNKQHLVMTLYART